MNVGRYQFAAGLLLVVLITATIVSPARSEDLSRYCGHPVASHNITLTREPLDPSTCTTNCFQFVLTCANGRKFLLTSRYNPYEPDAMHWLAIAYPLPQLVIFGIVAFLAFLMWKGRALKPGLNYTYLGIVALAAYFWPLISTSTGISRDFVMMASAFAVLGFPFFVVLNLPPLMRGWDYVFVKHPVQPLVETAIGDGTSIDTRGVAKTLKAGAYDRGAHPAYHYENQAEKARAIRDALEKDAAAADALRRREEARAELAEAERQVEEAKRRAGRTG